MKLKDRAIAMLKLLPVAAHLALAENPRVEVRVKEPPKEPEKRGENELWDEGTW